MKRYGGYLRGWKEISEFLGVSVSTGITYAKQYGLPVRVMGKGIIIGFEDELREWQKKFKRPYVKKARKMKKTKRKS